MKNLVIILAVLACAGIPVMSLFSPPDFGVSPTAPLGDFRKIEEWLAGKNFEKSEAKISEKLLEKWGDKLRGSTKYNFKWKKQNMSGMAREVSIIIGPDGTVRAINARFMSGAAENQKPESTPEELVWNLWQTIAQRHPKFTRTKTGRGIFTQWIHVDFIDAGGVKGQWMKRYLEQMQDNTIYDAVSLYTDDE